MDVVTYSRLPIIDLYCLCDQGIKFCSIFKVFRMRRKQCHCIYLVFLIPAVYLLLQTESIWRRYHDLTAKPNRQKIWDADCTYPYNPYDHVDGHTIMMTWCISVGCSLAHFHWLTWMSGMLTRVHFCDK
jgi:hypothetical protein